MTEIAPRVAAVAPGDPRSVKTFSGISAGLLGALHERGSLVGAVDGYPRLLRRVEQAASFSPDRTQWRQRFHGGISPVGPWVREGMSVVARRRAERLVRAKGADVLLQLTGWYRPSVPGVLRASYHDGNLASYLSRPDTLVDRESPSVRHLLAWERKLYDQTAVIFTMSEWLRQSFIQDFEQHPDKVVAVGAGTDLSAVAEAAAREWDRPHFLFVGRDFERKGGRELLSAWPAVRTALPEAELRIVGPKTVGGRLPAGATLIGEIDRRTAEGRDAYMDAYRWATSLVVPSLYEPFGIVFLEAMAQGLPCVAANRCAMPEIVDEGVSGRTVDPSDPNALTRALLELAQPDTARRMGAAGARRLQERFTWAAVADRVVVELTRRLG